MPDSKSSDVAVAPAPSGAADEAARLAVPSALLHELRTPVHQIIGYVEMLAEDAASDDNAALANDLERVRGAAAQLQILFDENFVASAGRAPAPDAPSAPLAQSAPAPTSAVHDDDQSLASGAEKGLLLVVDDNETNRDILSRRLQMQGYTTETAPDGARALELVATRVFDLVLLDIMMPDMDGYEVLRRLKADASSRDLPVIMISAIGDIDSVARCIEMGAEDYLPKPFNPTLLKARIGACLEKKRGHDRELRLFAQLQGNYQRLQELEKMRDDLVNMIVHDLRTPLSSLLAGLQTVSMLGPLSPGQTECCDIALRGGFSLLEMINDLLDISKFESGAPNLELAPFDVAGLVSESREQVQSVAQSRDIGWEIEIAPDVPIFEGDEGKLRRALVNLLGNAIKFSPDKSVVTIGARLQPNPSARDGEADSKPLSANSADGESADAGRELLMWVSDRGEGIPQAAFGRIFEKFGQVEERLAGRSMSTGLGLALCKMVVEAHRGRIWVESELGQGSTFYFALPVPA